MVKRLVNLDKPPVFPICSRLRIKAKMTAPLQIAWHGREMAAVTEIVKIDTNLGTSVETAVEVPSLDAGAYRAA